MLKLLVWVLAIAAVSGLSAGGIHLLKVARKNQQEMARYAGPKVTVADRSFGKVLVIYYSLSGKTRDIAERIRQKTGGDIYEIKTVRRLKTTPWFYLTLRQDLKNGKYPELSGDMPDFSGYDTVFVGSPVWWYTAATPMLEFLRRADFQGKKVIPFSTQGSNYGRFFEDFASAARNADLGEGQSFNNLSSEYNAQVDNKIAEWLNRL